MGREIYYIRGKLAEKKEELKCPYCDSTFKTRSELSKHIDRIHIGSGLLEGDRTKW